MTASDDFYAARDARTLAYGITPGVLTRPVGIVVGTDAAGNPAAQATVLALVNLLARVHRSLSLWLPDARLVAPAMVQATSLAEACAATARAIDPYINVALAGPGTRSRTGAGVPTIAIGTEVPPGCTIYLGAERFLAVLANRPVPVSADPLTVLGGGLAACLAAGELMRALYGHHARARVASLWNFGEGGAAEAGPELGMSPIDVGDIAIVGAGAVGSAFAYWARQFGHAGDWAVVDHDQAELHNINRSMGITAADAGWSAGRTGGKPAAKAELAAGLLGAEPYDGWYHQWVAQPGRRPDLILPLANEFDVRRVIGQRGEPVLIHATTSPNWTAELHRHLAGRDGCIDCRLPQPLSGSLRCATGPVPELAGAPPANGGEPGRRPDAALPFLSAAAGLLLLTALIQLEHDVFAAHRVQPLEAAVRAWAPGMEPLHTPMRGKMPARTCSGDPADPEPRSALGAPRLTPPEPPALLRSGRRGRGPREPPGSTFWHWKSGHRPEHCCTGSRATGAPTPCAPPADVRTRGLLPSGRRLLRARVGGPGGGRPQTG